ncbi:hypothetical protein OAL15_02405 [Flavobacteriales bacterium]|nr:hypothetical protein [Flavobacteriales bacterium]
MSNPLFKFFFVLSFSLLFSSGHLENPDTHLRLTQVRTLVQKGTIAIDPGFGEESHGNIATNQHGVKYSVYNPGQMILLAPIYYVASFVSKTDFDAYYRSAFIISFLGFIIHGLTILVFWSFGHVLGIQYKPRLIATVVFALTSYGFSSAQDSYEHMYEAFFILLAFRLTFIEKISVANGFLIGSVLGLALLFRSTAVLGLPALIYLVKGRHQRFSTIGGFLVFVSILGIYNYLRFDNPFETGYTSAWETAYGIKPEETFSFYNMPKHLLGLVLSPSKGIVIFSLSLIVVAFGFKHFYHAQTRLFLAITGLAALFLLFYSANFAWHGSAWCWGPRYILAVVPLMYLSLFYVSKPSKKVFAFIYAISFVIQMLGVATYYKRDLIKKLIVEGDIFWTDDYYFNPVNSPVIGSYVSFKDVTSSVLLRKDKFLFLPDGPWKNENRPATQQQMLDSSIDLTCYNFWWFRALYITDSWFVKILALTIPSIALAYLFFFALNLLHKSNV